MSQNTIFIAKHKLEKLAFTRLFKNFENINIPIYWKAVLFLYRALSILHQMEYWNSFFKKIVNGNKEQV